ncbi:hypothetical protein HRI_003346300 [Hibiscus trionum]|uniref:Uncharacterized protein n=1 Tax=Hibiscus trionum TaxID=183268 RepID=A0A9W7MG26_HIBTR|nr:hypothetical protein HRI_003346300 [Hibiscus trionum]
MESSRSAHQLCWTILFKLFLMAPFFVLLEVLQSLFGYEPYPGFHARVKAKIEAEIKEWKDKKHNKIS